jgi:16S rRNA processing protein RimM
MFRGIVIESMSERASRLVIVGRVAGVYGVRGWVKVYSSTEPPEAILDYPSWQLRSGSDWRPMKLIEGRRHGKGIVAHLASCDDRDVARDLVGAEIAVPRGQMPDPGTDHYYWADLEGLAVRTVGGVELGVVDHLLETGANDVLVVKGERERLIPYVRGTVVTEVDLEQGKIVVDWDPEF